MNEKIYNIDEIKTISTEVFKKLNAIDKAYLFGSYARNEAKENSDIDFLLYLRNYDLDSLEEYVEASGTLNFSFNKEIDVLLPKDLSDKKKFRDAVERDKVLIYERKNQDKIYFNHDLWIY